jgi:hypothetical protein
VFCLRKIAREGRDWTQIGRKQRKFTPLQNMFLNEHVSMHNVYYSCRTERRKNKRKETEVEISVR